MLFLIEHQSCELLITSLAENVRENVRKLLFFKLWIAVHRKLYVFANLCPRELDDLFEVGVGRLHVLLQLVLHHAVDVLWCLD